MNEYDTVSLVFNMPFYSFNFFFFKEVLGIIKVPPYHIVFAAYIDERRKINDFIFFFHFNLFSNSTIYADNTESFQVRQSFSRFSRQIYPDSAKLAAKTHLV